MSPETYLEATSMLILLLVFFSVLLRVTPWLRVSVVKALLLIFPVAYGLLPLAWGVVACGLLPTGSLLVLIFPITCCLWPMA